MVLGSWAIVQMQAGRGRRPGRHRVHAVPVQVGRQVHSVAGGDYNHAINVNSKNKATARAWIDWFTTSRATPADQGGVSPLVDGPVPRRLAGLHGQASSSSR